MLQSDAVFIYNVSVIKVSRCEQKMTPFMRGPWPDKLIKVASSLCSMHTLSHSGNKKSYFPYYLRQKWPPFKGFFSGDANQTNSQRSSPAMASSERGSKTSEKYASERSPRHLSAVSQQAAAQLRSRNETLKGENQDECLQN